MASRTTAERVRRLILPPGLPVRASGEPDPRVRYRGWLRFGRRRRRRRRWRRGGGRRGRLAEVRRPENLLAAVGQDDVGLLGHVHVRRAALHFAAVERDLVADLR